MYCNKNFEPIQHITCVGFHIRTVLRILLLPFQCFNHSNSLLARSTSNTRGHMRKISPDNHVYNVWVRLPYGSLNQRLSFQTYVTTFQTVPDHFANILDQWSMTTFQTYLTTFQTPLWSCHIGMLAIENLCTINLKMYVLYWHKSSFIGFQKWYMSFESFRLFHLQHILLQARMWSVKPKVRWFDFKNWNAEICGFLKWQDIKCFGCQCQPAVIRMRGGHMHLQVAAMTKNLSTRGANVLAPNASLLWLEWEEALWVVARIRGWWKQSPWRTVSWWRWEEGRARGEARCRRLSRGSGEVGRGGRGCQDLNPGEEIEVGLGRPL